MLNIRKEFWKLTEKSVFAKALIEWALCTLSAEEFKMKLSENDRSQRFFDLHLEGLIRNTENTVKGLIEFIGLKNENEVITVAEQLLRRDLTLTVSKVDFTNDEISEEELLRIVGSDIRNLIFHHSFHI